MAEQRDRAKADAQVQEGPAPRRHAPTARSPTRSAAPVEFTGYAEVVTEGAVARHRRRRRRRSTSARRGRRGRAGARPHPVLRRGRRPARRPGRHRARQRRPARGARRAVADHRPDRAPGAGARRRGHRSAPARRRWSTSSAAGRSRRAHTATHMVHKAFREALGETATQAGSENAPGRFRFDFSATGAVPDVGDGRRRGAGQRPGARRPRGARRDHDARTRPCSPARWRCSARSTATRCGSSRSATGPASSAAAPTRPLRPARRGQAARRVLDRLRRTPGRGAGRRRRLPVPGPRARAGRPAHRGAQGAPRGAARAGRRHRRAAARRREGDREGPRRTSCWPPAASSRPAPRTSAGVDVRRATAPTAPAAATCARSRSTCAAGCPAAEPGVVVDHRRRRRQGRRRGRAVNDAARARGVSRQRAGPGGRPAASAARAAARTTSPRAAAPTPRRIDEALAAGRDRGRPRGRSLTRAAGVRLGVDPGDARIGVARSDPSGFLATPVETVRARRGRPGPARRDPRRGGGASRSSSGCPARCPGGEGPAAAKVREFAAALARPGRTGAGAAVRRAADHGVGGGYAARPGAQGQQAARRGRPGRRRRDPAARTGHRARARGRAPGEIVEAETT